MMSIFYIGHTYGRIGYSVVNHCVYGYCYTVFGQNLEFFPEAEGIIKIPMTTLLTS